MIYWRTTEVVNGERVQAAAKEVKTIILDDKYSPVAPAESVQGACWGGA